MKNLFYLTTGFLLVILIAIIAYAPDAKKAHDGFLAKRQMDYQAYSEVGK